jgi:glucosylglycerate synthase
MLAAAEPTATHGERPTLLSDDLVRSLVAAGQVDVLVGVPTLDNAGTVAGVVKAVVASFAGPLARKRCLLLDADGGSHDGTPEIVRGIPPDGSALVLAAHALRTIHRISAPYHGIPGRGSGLRLLFAAADLVGARAVVIVDPDARDLTAETVATLAHAVLEERCDFVKPLGGASPWERPLVTQLVAPLMSAILGRRLRDPIASQFACSGMFAASALSAAFWDTALARDGIDVWLAARAMSGSARVGEVWAPGAVEPPHPRRPRAHEAFQQVVGAVFESLVAADPRDHARSPGDTLVLGDPQPSGAARPAFDISSFSRSFVQGVTDLGPILGPALGEPLLGVLLDASGTSPPPIDDALWASVVVGALSAVHRRALPASQIVAALFPLYLGRVAAFLDETRAASVVEAEARLDQLALAFAHAKTKHPDLLRDATR